MFGKRIKDPDVLFLLSKVLRRKDSENKVSPVSPNGEKGMYNLYSMLIFMDAIIKYQIIVEQDIEFDNYLSELKKLSDSYHSHKELVIGVNSLLGEMVRRQLGLPDLIQYANKKAVLERVYDRYIVNGFCFHSFPSFFKEEVEFNGIDPRNYQYPINKMKQIAYIFENHRYPHYITKNLEEKVPALYITDSPAMAYFYAFSSPSYFSNMTATGEYMKKGDYDRFAYYRRDYLACKRNLEKIAEHIHLSAREQQIVLEAFEEQWNRLQVSQSVPCIAFIKRKEVGRNFLKEITQILEDARYEDFVVSMSKITDSRYPRDRRFTPILSLDFTVEVMPTYEEILKGKVPEVMQTVTSKPVIEKLFTEESIQVSTLENKEPDEQKLMISKKQELINNHGNADVIALCGLLSVISGLTLHLVFRYFGVG